MYKIPLHTWVVVANTCNATIFEYFFEKPPLRTVDSFSLPHIHSRDMALDRPGRVFESSTTAHHAYPDTDEIWHRKEDIEMAKNIVDFLQKGWEKKNFQHLILVAPDHLFAQIRHFIPTGAQSDKLGHAVLKEIAKDLTHIPHEELVEKLVD